MRVLLFVSFLINLESLEAQNFETLEDFSDFSRSASVVINELFTSKRTSIPTINLVTPESSKSFRIKDFVCEMLRTSMESNLFALRLETVSKVKVLNRRRRFKNIFVIETFDDFVEISEKLTPEMYKFSGQDSHNFVIFINENVSKLPEIFKTFWQLRTNNVNAIHPDQNREALVKIFQPFGKKCNDMTPVIISKGKNGTFENKNFFPEQLRNLQTCPIRVSIADDIDPFIFVDSNDKTKLSGRDIEVIKTLSHALNFTLNFAYIGKEGFFMENGTAVGPLKLLMNNEADLSISDWWLKVNRLKFLSATSSYISDRLILIVPPGQEYSNFEKLIYPFAVFSWILVLFSLFVGACVIFAVKRRSRKVQNFVFGENIRHPYLNMFAVFMGDSQQFLPKTNFARFLLTMILIYSLVIRCLYQGSYFQLMQSDQKHPEVQSIDEMVEKDYKLYVIDGVTDITQVANAMATR